MTFWINKPEKAPKPSHRCPVHGEIFYTLSVYGSKFVCQKCIADFLDKTMPDVEELK